jgi:hypothetical protein
MTKDHQKKKTIIEQAGEDLFNHEPCAAIS